MRSIAALFLALAAFAAPPSHARPADGAISEEWVVVEGAGRLVAAAPALRPPALAEYGPFLVLDERRAALVDATDAASPARFAAMLRDYPAIGVLEMIECPGTDDDRANLALGRMIRAARIETHVPRGGSVRSGAVELFLAGAARRADDGAEFAVHSWIDELGREVDDVAAGAPEHRAYLDYYVEMGMDPGRARAFYDMTNSVPNGAAKWLTAQDMRGWLAAPKRGGVTVPAPRPEPRIAYLDLDTRLP